MVDESGWGIVVLGFGGKIECLFIENLLPKLIQYTRAYTYVRRQRSLQTPLVDVSILDTCTDRHLL